MTSLHAGSHLATIGAPPRLELPPGGLVFEAIVAEAAAMVVLNGDLVATASALAFRPWKFRSHGFPGTVSPGSAENAGFVCRNGKLTDGFNGRNGNLTKKDMINNSNHRLGCSFHTCIPGYPTN